MKRFNWSVLALLFCGLSMAQAALLDEARVVSATASLASMVPESATVTVATAGTYTLTLTDLGELPNPDIADPFTSLSVVISQGAQKIKYLTVPAGASVVTDSVVLAIGQYQVQVLGVTPGASLYGVELKDASNTTAPVLSDTETIVAPASNNGSSLRQVLNLAAGNYTVTLTDRVFPVAFDSLISSIAQGNNPVACPLNTAATNTATCTFTASPSGNLLVVLAREVTGGAGLYSVKVTDSSGKVAYAATLPVGVMPEPVAVPLPATDTYLLSSYDLNTPDPLSALKLALVQGGEVAIKATAGGSAVSFTGSTGIASLYAIATPVTSSAGLYGVQIKRGTALIYNRATPVEGSNNSSVPGYLFTANLPTAGQYTLQLRDFVFPQAFTALTARVSQGGTTLGAPLSGAGSLTVNAQAGDLIIAVLATPGSNAAALGLFGISLSASGGSTPVLEITQGVGGNFSSNVVTIPAAARYALTATDYAAPDTLDQFWWAVTRGSQWVGGIYGGGSIPFDTTAGDYTLSFITKAKTSASFGMYGINLVAAPTVTLTASATSVASGGTATLNWSSTDASACTASGGWTGSKTTSGSASVGPLTANTTFTLTCTGPAGNAAQSANITIQAAPTSKSGGGSFSWLLMLGLGVLAMARTPRSAKLR